MTYDFDILYGKSKDGKIRTWKISVEKYSNYSEIVILHGYNRKIETRRRIAYGKNLNKKNATTHYQQAILEATSKWNKKQTIDNYSTNNNSTNNNSNNNNSTNNNSTDNIDTPLNNINKSSNCVTFPMLAQDYSKHKNKVTFPCFVQPKLDGYRMIYNTISKSITTRQGKDFNIVKQTSKLYNELSSLPQKYIFDGELYVHNNEVSFETLGVLRKTKKLTSQDKINLDKIEYHIYDIIDTTLPYNTRKNLLDDLFKNNNFTMIKYVNTFKINSKEDILNYHQNFVNTLGYEGTMIRNYNGMYKEKYRSFDLLKFKDFMDAEFEIVDYTFEKDTSGEDKNLIVWIILIKNDIFCKVRPKGSKEQRQDLYLQCQNNFSQFKGKKLWTKFFEYTNDGNLRFPTTKTNDISSYIRNEII